MEIWLAFSGFEEMEKAHAYPIKGVLTNPTIVSRAGMGWREAISRMNEIGDLPLGLQVVSTEMDRMLEEVETYRGLVNRKPLIIKLPFCRNALRVVGFIKKRGLGVNVAAVCTFSQAVVALETDPDYISIYVGRVSDGGGNGAELVRKIKTYAVESNKRTLVLAASLRDACGFEEAALAGADAAVVTLPVLEDAVKSGLTDESIATFKEEWKKAEGA